MKSRLMNGVKLLAGSVSIYVLAAACSGGSRATMTAIVDGGLEAFLDAMGAAGMDSMPGESKDAGKVRDASTGSLKDAVADVMSDVSNPVHDAKAQGAPNCATCTGPAMRTTTADSDPEQIVSTTFTVPAASLDHGSTTLVAQGPLMVYHADTMKGLTYYVVDAGKSCAFDPTSDADTDTNVATPLFSAVSAPGHHQVISGPIDRGNAYQIRVRLLDGEKLCAKQIGDCACQISPAPAAYPARIGRLRGFKPYG